MDKNILQILDKIVHGIGSVQSLLIHASSSKRTKAEIREDLDKMSDILSEIRKLIY